MTCTLPTDQSGMIPGSTAAEGADPAAPSPTTSASGLSSNISPYSRRQLSVQGSNGTWECRVHRKCDELRQLFGLPCTESPIEDFHCALQKKICLQGRLYLFQHHVCFYSNLFGFIKFKVIPLQDVMSVTKRKNVGFPNSIEIVWSNKGRDKQEFFTSFLHRREAYKLITSAWLQCSSLAQHQMAEGHFGSRSSPGSSFSGRHGSIASCASLPDVNSLPHTDLGMTTMSRQASEAQSSGFDGQADRSQSQASADAQLPALPDTRLPLKYNRAASWGPQGTSHNSRDATSPFANAVAQQVQKSIPAFGGPRESDDIAVPSGSGEWAAEGGAAPPAPLAATKLLDSILHVELHDFCRKFLADEAVFWQEFHESRGDMQIRLSSWSRHTALGHVRELSFISPIKALIGPPQAECHQSQRYRMYRGNHLVLETSQSMPNIPFGDHFTVEVRWDITQVAGDPSQCRLQSQVSVPFSKATWWKKAIQKGSIDSCREAHEDWLAKVQATLAAPAHVLVAPTHSSLASLHSLASSHRSSHCDTTQGEVDELLERLPKEHRQAVARVISMASQGSLCATSSPRSTAADAVQVESGLRKQASQAGISRMTKTTRFTDTPAQQEDSLAASLSRNMSGIPTGASAHWMVTRLMPRPSHNAALLLVLAAAIIALQVVILLGGSMPGKHVVTPKQPLQAAVQPEPMSITQLQQGFASLQHQVEALAQALAAHGIKNP
ncbi:TPA: hypothetical protein ACH3X2_002859 [Trebouxia sp. C0005]